MKNWNSKQNIRPKKGICSYLVKVDTIYTEGTELFCASFWCPYKCFLPVKLWSELRAGILQLKILFDQNAWWEGGNILL